MIVSSELLKDISTSSSIDELNKIRDILQKIASSYPDIDLSLPIDIISSIITSKTKSAYYLFWCEDMNLEWSAEDGYMLYQNLDGEELTCILPPKESHELNIESRRIIKFLKDNNISSVLTWDSENFSFEDRACHHSCNIYSVQDQSNWDIVKSWIRVEVVNILK